MKNTITLIVSLVVILIFGLLVVSGISFLQNPIIHYGDKWIQMNDSDLWNKPIYCAQKPVSWLYDRLTSLLVVPVFYCFNTQAERQAWIADKYPSG